MTGLGNDGVLDVCDSPMDGLTVDPEDVLQRSHSTSSIHDILHQSQMAMSYIKRLESPLKSRSSSYDDIVSLSGSPTPTPTPSKAQFRI